MNNSPNWALILPNAACSKYRGLKQLGIVNFNLKMLFNTKVCVCATCIMLTAQSVVGFTAGAFAVSQIMSRNGGDGMVEMRLAKSFCWSRIQFSSLSSISKYAEVKQNSPSKTSMGASGKMVQRHWIKTDSQEPEQKENTQIPFGSGSGSPNTG